MLSEELSTDMVSALWCAVCTVQPLVSSLPSPVSSLQSPVSSLQSPVSSLQSSPPCCVTRQW
jgi:hypothetical protein